MKKIFSIAFALFAGFAVAYAQNTFPATGAAGIGTNTPNASSLLDITSTTKGVLIPRMTKAQRDAIAAPVEGLMIYQTNSTQGFYFYDGNSWEPVSAKGATKSLGNLVSPTSVGVDLLPGTDNLVNIGSSAFSWKDIFAEGNAYVGNGIHIGGTTLPAARLEITPTSTIPAAIRVNPFVSGITGGTGEMQFMETVANGTNYVGFKAPASISANKVWTLPAADGTNGQVLSTNGAGALSWVTGTGGGAETDPQVGTNTTSFIPRWNGTALVTGSMYDDGTNIGIGSSSPLAKVYINSDASPTVPNLWINESTGTDYARLRFSSIAGDERKWEIVTKTSNTLETANTFIISQTHLNPVSQAFDSDSRLVIDNSGQVGIGTSLPLARLNVTADDDEVPFLISDNQLGTILKVTPGSTGGLSVGNGTAPSHGLMVTGQSILGSTSLTLATTFDLGVDADAYFKSRVAIGTTSPNSTLHVNAPSGDDAMRIQVNGASKLFVSSTGGVTVGSATTPPANGLYVTGSLGIGTATPDARLRVEATGTENPFKVVVNGNSKMYLSNNGGLAIGNATTADPNGLYVFGNGKFGGASNPVTLSVSGSGKTMIVSGTDPYIQLQNGVTDKAYMRADGDNLLLATNSE
ncbi:MAG: hypothetical protein WBB36_14185, partial [Chitinophagales bacterium]